MNLLVQFIAIEVKVFFHPGDVGITDVLLIKVPVKMSLIVLILAEKTHLITAKTAL